MPELKYVILINFPWWSHSSSSNSCFMLCLKKEYTRKPVSNEAGKARIFWGTSQIILLTSYWPRPGHMAVLLRKTVQEREEAVPGEDKEHYIHSSQCLLMLTCCFLVNIDKNTYSSSNQCSIPIPGYSFLKEFDSVLDWILDVIPVW